MQKNPIDDILDKIVCEVLKKFEFDSVSHVALNSLSDLIKNFINKIGVYACEETQQCMKANVSLFEIKSAIDTIYPVSILNHCLKENLYADMGKYSFPNSSFQRITPISLSKSGHSLPAFFPPLPPTHISFHTDILSVQREGDKPESRKRLLEERQKVKKSICLVNESEPSLWENQEQLERKKQRVEEESAQPIPYIVQRSKNPSMLPAIPQFKPMAIESGEGISSTDPVSK